MHRSGLKWIMAVYFPRGQQTFKTLRDKFVADLAGVSTNSAVGMAFVCNQEISLSDRQQLRAAAGCACDIYHLERMVAILDQPKMRQVRAQFLNIGPDDAGQRVVDVVVQRQILRERIDTIATAIQDLVARPRGRGTNDHYFILEVDGIEGFYAQFMRSDVGVYAELVSSRFLSRWHRLSDMQEELLVEQGWEPPNEGIPNFHRDFATNGRPTFAIDLARRVLDTLIHVYGVHESDPVIIRTSYD